MEKKILVITCVILCLIALLCSCSTKKPEDVAEDYISGAIESNYDKMDENSVVSQETLFMAQINSYLQQSDMTEEEIWEILAESYGFDKIPQTYNEYRTSFMAYVQESMKKQYGDDFAVKTSVITSIELSEEEISTMLKEASDYYDNYNIIVSDIINFANIKECRKVTCKVYLSGEKVEDDDSIQEISVFVINMSGKWKVLNLGLGA